ncbi:MAG: hypothetical protein A2X12_08000 [Bacteroidetes bacterium GWE2_29_8]|nr:MAG: hypothetical protein A2X12_08000 [Bacteroidetes bacterium GWE2_29_8]OFY16188.1 MAG: hypothetical protein A2X02_07240 [Bacteroidetes bacterium GWF2_29_10]
MNYIYEREIEVCYTPALFPFYNPENKIVVVVDILRATSAICSAFENNVKEIVPIANVEDAFKLKDQGYIIAAERNGERVDGADMGNSPFEFLEPSVRGKSIAFTTTNGTQAIEIAKQKNIVVIGAFLNHRILCNWLIHQQKDILVLCAGWKGKFNLEDTYFAGALIEYLTSYSNFTTTCDSAMASRSLYLLAKDNLYDFLSNSSHFERLKKLNKLDDIRYCLSMDKTNVIPVLKDDVIVNICSSN